MSARGFAASLGRRFSFEFNGMRNHELYFSHFEGGPANFRITDHKGPYEEYQQQLAIAAK